VHDDVEKELSNRTPGLDVHAEALSVLVAHSDARWQRLEINVALVHIMRKEGGKRRL